jgi:hypothetical protein
MSDHPRRFLYFQALEHYLRSFQLLRGEVPEKIRGYDHDFASRLKACKAEGLQLSEAAEEFIGSPVRSKEHVRMRYDYKLDHHGSPVVAQLTMEQLREAIMELEQAVDIVARGPSPQA